MAADSPTSVRKVVVHLRATDDAPILKQSKFKTACGLMPKDLVVKIDATDMDNELAATKYIDDIYKFYKLTKDDGRVHDYMASQPDINARMKPILVDWLIERSFSLLVSAQC